MIENGDFVPFMDIWDELLDIARLVILCLLSL